MKPTGLKMLLAGGALSSGALAQATSGDLTILSMNVAGLPQFLQNNEVPGDKTTNSKTIGTLFSAYNYDIINVQEDFNYHAYIYQTDRHAYRTATSGGVPFGSGLNTLSNYNWVDFERVKWNTCSDASSNDCLTPKGFTFMRVRLDEGVYVDVINLHTDAGTEAGDSVARNSNLKQVADYIDANSAGNAVLIFGDTNSRYTRLTPDDIGIFGTQNGMTDSWVQLVRDGVVPTAETLCDNPSTTSYCETVDKNFYRGSPVLNLEATAWNYASEKFLQPDGNILSDHNPIAVNFTWSLSSTLRQSDFSGGPHGTWFSDLPALAGKSKPKAATLNFSGDERLDSVGLTLTDGTAFKHGGSGGTAATLALDASEFWTAATLCTGQKNNRTRNFYIQATTSTGRTLQSGTQTSDCTKYTAPAGWQIVGFLGRDGDEVDRLAFAYAPQ
ncbi:endonuclease/Exonuclease/phosphatase [Colletotrichum graminicola]|uniref:Endonuclease/Exonuclease/phosphatase n=1 Tax=Colletotrichum graminicola (strain M1.001 / M2 / FGSC 10212) TaxID=645133 RepID=E3QWU4_COLGM|nr:endonuclease/Exonuclease/phosphatase [Colletotrichum graminicola M1.001]EFQ35332.1 endonuclease/Exonuclease/phosphatase [Colletotrichum graminicola M1.001]WDK22086.1 endonuclease/Exonuclease/phosphatase [Colletotrichum graminicola]